MSKRRKRLLGTTSSKSYVYFRSGVRAQQTGRFNDAEILYRRALQEDPDNRPAGVNLLVIQILQEVQVIEKSLHESNSEVRQESINRLETIRRELGEFLPRAKLSKDWGKPYDDTMVTARYQRAAINAYLNEVIQRQSETYSGQIALGRAALNEAVLEANLLQEEVATAYNASNYFSILKLLEFRREKDAYQAYLKAVQQAAVLLKASLFIRQASIDEAEHEALLQEADILLKEYNHVALRSADAYETAAYYATRQALTEAWSKVTDSVQSDEQALELTRQHLKNVLIQNEEMETRVRFDPRFYSLRGLQQRYSSLRRNGEILEEAIREARKIVDELQKPSSTEELEE